MRTLTPAVLASLFVLAGCDRPSVSTPTPGQLRQPSPTPDVPAVSLLIGVWQGSSRVESTEGTPECIAPFWETGFTETLDAMVVRRPELVRSGGSELDMHLLPQASEQIHLAVGASSTLITGVNWPFLEDCPLVPYTCGLEGHFRLDSSRWGCSGAPPEVWITGMRLTAAFDDDSQRRFRGTIEIGYAHQPGCSRCGPPWASARIVKHFELSKQQTTSAAHH